MTTKLRDDCFVPTAPRLTHAEALTILKSRLRRLVDSERCSITAALGRYLAETVTASLNVPGHTNSAVDGYAFAFDAYDGDKGLIAPLSGRAAAGHPVSGRLAAGHALRIFTGAALPTGVDTVAMQEDCVIGPDGRIAIPGGLKRASNVRRAGEDVPVGHVMFDDGHAIRPQDVAALASIGRAEATVYRKLRVGILSTGDEVVQPGQPLAFGQVFDANAPMLTALLTAAGVEIHHLGIAPDRADQLDRQLIAAAQAVDVIIATGGASKGEEDHMVAAFDRLGQRHLWQLAIKPGRPMSFGTIGNTVTVGLPGNPVAVFICYLFYVVPMLRVLGGGTWREPRRFRLPANFDFKGRKTGRREFWRGLLVETPSGWVVDKFRRDGSGLISGLRAADGIIDIPEDHGDVARGDMVAFIPLTEFGIGH